eukprot:TRINITY_DN19339_c0_g1_i2.p3 TRINITY_DN19339_c0_g1~~TRINITY_DN19339_c0_g1_i2.p3  ORF type:complete len:102 (+),score=36.03 TRINITY_DN19339_c0_g1_i2:630-935(+)
MAYQSHSVLKEIFSTTNLNLEMLAVSFGLEVVPPVKVKRESQEYVKGKIKSMWRKKLKEEEWRKRAKGHRQWDPEGNYIGREPDRVAKVIGKDRIRKGAGL